MMIGGNISELKIVVSLATDKVKQGVASVKTQMTSLKRSVDNATASIKPSFKKVVKPIEDVSTSTKEASFAMKMFGQGGASVANTLSVALSKINPQFGQMREGISAVGSSMKGLAKTSKGAMVAVGAAIAAIAAVAIAKVAKAMYDRVSELVAFAAPDEYKKATEGMNNAINKLKTSIGTVLVPIFSMISKVIEVVADALTWFVEKVVAPYWGFISGMFGWMDAFDTSGVSSVSDTMSDASDSTGKMADDVKEMGKGLAGFDKLTVQSKSSDSSSASTDDTPLGNVDDVKRNAEQYNKIKESMMGGAKFAEKIKTKISAILEPVKRAIVRIKGIIDKIVKAVSKIDLKKTLNDAKERVLELASTVKGKIANLNKAIEDGVSEAWDNITSTFGGLWENITSTVGGWFGGFGKFAEQAGEDIKDGINGAIDTVAGWFSDIFNLDWEGIWDDLVDSFNDVVSTISGLFSGFFDIDWDGIFYGLRNAFTKAINFVIDQWNKFIPDMIGIDVFGNKIGINTGALHLSRLPELANGGVVNPNNPMPVIVGDNTKEKEAIAPVSTLEAMIDRSVRNAMNRYDNQPSRQDITLNIDGRKLARITHNYNAIENRRRGATIARSV